MPLTVIETPADPAANSYVTLQEANDYMATRLHSDAWITLTDEQKSAAIISATSWLDATYRWTGAPTTTTQRLGWPRTGMRTRNEQPIDPMVLPFDLKKATAEFSYALAAEDRTSESGGSGRDIAEIEAGPVRLKFADKSKTTSETKAQTIVPDAVQVMLPPSWYIDPDLVAAVASGNSLIFMADR